MKEFSVILNIEELMRLIKATSIAAYQEGRIDRGEIKAYSELREKLSREYEKRAGQ